MNSPSSCSFFARALLALIVNASFASPAAAEISAIWANEGGDKVTQGELRVGSPNGRKVLSRAWDGTTVKLFGARNEIVSFNLILEAATQAATSVHVSFDTLTGPGAAVIQSTATTGNGVFNWIGRPIELFYIRYLQIKGLTRNAYANAYDERHVPERLRRPWSGNGVAAPGTKWQDRPDHDAYYPDIAVPLELVPSFGISAGQNQGIWADIYVPKTAAPGHYTGEVTVTDEAGSHVVPVALDVLAFTLPDEPSAKTMLYYSGQNVNERYLGQRWIEGADEARAKLIQDRHFLVAHRHKISMIGDNTSIASDYPTEEAEDHPTTSWIPRLQPGFFSAAVGSPGTELEFAL